MSSEPRAKPIAIGKLSGTVYTFTGAGDVLPPHTHDENSNHISIVARGSFTLHSSKVGTLELKTGAAYVTVLGEEHSFTALEPNSRLFNIVY